MEIKVDTHSHTVVSGHAYSTMHEMAQAGYEHGLEALSITEHAPQMPGTCGTFYFCNLDIVPRKMNNIQVLHGVEANILDGTGALDLDNQILGNLDIVLASIHPPCYTGELTKQKITETYVNVMKNPYVDIIGHPDDGRFPIDYELLVKSAKETGTLLEINNSSLRPNSFRENAWQNMIEMLNLCKKNRVYITTGSDAHVDVEAGIFTKVTEILLACDFPEELVVTTSLEKLKRHLKIKK